MRKEIFTTYYNKNSWHGKESVSGPGSDYEQTKFLIPELTYLLKDLNIKSMLDAPCGDFNWMKKVDLNKINYIGVDIVDELIERNIRKYTSKTKKFDVLDIVTDKIPTVDLVMVRDCFVHLPNQDIISALRNIKNSKSKYLLTTNFFWEHLECNSDIKVGGWRRINFCKDPFNFKYPEKIIVEGNIQSNDRDKSMSLWKVEDIPDFEVTNG